MYKRDIDLNSLPINQGKKDHPEHFEIQEYSNEEIIDSVVEQMKDTLFSGKIYSADDTSVLALKEQRTKALLERYNLNIGDIYYHFNQCGTLFHGMHKFKLNRIDEGCSCDTPYYVEFESTNNNGNKYTKHVNSNEIKKYFKSEKDAWSFYKDILKQDIKKSKHLIERYKNCVEQIDNIIKEINVNSSTFVGEKLDWGKL
jgi:hypothetical protein